MLLDMDANPDLSNRYGDWGWPATIVFVCTDRICSTPVFKASDIAAAVDRMMKITRQTKKH